MSRPFTRQTTSQPEPPSGSEIRALRLNSGLTYADLAQLTGIPARLLAQIEHGLRPIQPDQLHQIARALGVAPQWLSDRLKDSTEVIPQDRANSQPAVVLTSGSSAANTRIIPRPGRSRALTGMRIGEGARLALVLLIALVQGLTYMSLLPPWQHYEEPTHFEYAWLIANRGRLPLANEVDYTMQREVAASMLEHNFYRDLPKPDLNNIEGFAIGSSEHVLQPPAYYILVSFPLRAVRHLDMTSQLYVARSISVMLFLLTILVVIGVMRDLTPQGHVLRWIVPLTVVLIPPFIDVMTAVNNDVGATLVFSLFLWGCVRTIRYGITWQRLLWIVGMALLGLVTKANTAVALALVPLALLIALWVHRGWDGRLLALATVLFLAVGTFALFDLGNAAYWYPWPNGVSQEANTRAEPSQTPFGAQALMVASTPASPGLLLNPILDPQRLAGQTVTIGGWLWADRPATIRAPGLLWNKQGTTRLDALFGQVVQVTTTPVFATQTFTVPKEVGTLSYTLFGNVVAPKNTALNIFLDGAFLMPGTFPASTTPVFDDQAGRTGTWAGRTFTNLVRNPSAEQAWPRLRPWVEQAIVQHLHISPAQMVVTLFDTQRSGGFLLDSLTRFLPFGFFAAFAWGHVRLPGDAWLYLFQGLLLVTLAGSLKWFMHNEAARSVRLAIALLGIAGLIVVGNTLLWPLMHFWGTAVPLPAARYTFPVIIPIALLLAGGWWALWPRAYRAHAAVALVIALVGLNAVAVQTIQSYYQSLP